MSEPAAWNIKTTPPLGGVRAWSVCLAAGFFFLYEFFQLNVFDVINPDLQVFFKLNAQSLSLMSSTYLLANVLFLLPAGIILDRFSVRYVIAFALFVCVLGTFGFALTTSWQWAMFFHALSGFGNAFCFLSCVILISRWFPPTQQAFVTGMIVTMAFVGGMMAHTPFVWVLKLVGFRKALLLDAVMGVVLLALIYLIVRDGPTGVTLKTAKTLKSIFLEIRAVLLVPATLLGGLYTSCMNLPVMVLCALWGASYLQTVHHLSPLEASSVSSMMFVGSILGCPLAGWISDHLRKRKPVMFFGVLATIPILFFLLYFSPLSRELLFFLFFLLGFFTSTQVVSYPLVAESNVHEYTGAAVGIASIIVMGGAGLSQILFGFLMNMRTFGVARVDMVSQFSYAMPIFLVAALVAFFVLFFISETYCEPRSSQ